MKIINNKLIKLNNAILKNDFFNYLHKKSIEHLIIAFNNNIQFHYKFYSYNRNKQNVSIFVNICYSRFTRRIVNANKINVFNFSILKFGIN